MTVNGIDNDNHNGDISVPSTKEYSHIASFWQRLGAILIDSLALGLLGQVIGWTFSSILSGIGPYGRFVGWIILLIYFGLLNSFLGNGQTLGKRVLKIAVRGSDGTPISVSLSFIRAFILTLPGILNGWQLPAFQYVPLLTVIQGITVIGVGTSLTYTMIFNRGSRQGFHDMICKTYVIHLVDEPVDTLPKTSRIHWVISTILLSTSFILSVVLSMRGSTLDKGTIFGIEITPIQNLYENYETDSRFFSVRVSDKHSYSNQRSPLRILALDAWYKGKLNNEDTTALMLSLVSTAIKEYENISEIDGISVTITSAYDVGIARGYFRFNETQTLEDWKIILYQP